MNVIIGLNEASIERLLKSRATFELVGLSGNFMAGIKLVETKIESLGLKCRVISDLKGAAMRGGALGAAATVMSAPATLTLAALTVVASVGHALATYDPDYEIVKDYVNKKLKIVYKK